MVRSAVSAKDADIGARIRWARQQRAMSQTDLAKTLKLSFQQVQKYEKGTNHVSAVRLHQIAHLLGVSIDYFFEALDAAAPGRGHNVRPVSSAAELVSTAESLDMITAFNRIKSAAVRRRCLALVRAVSDED